MMSLFRTTWRKSQNQYSGICVGPVKEIYFVYSAEGTSTAFLVHVQKKKRLENQGIFNMK